MVALFGKLFGFVMNIIYSFFKIQKTKNKVTFISRQGNSEPLDFKLIIDQLKANYPQYEVKVLCKVIPKSFLGKVGYVFYMFVQMNAMASSKVLVLDGYCILASILKHKKDLKIIQLWHALGSFKRFGKSILDMPGGSSSKTAEAFKMHNNYDYIATSGKKCVAHFSEAFGQPEYKFIPIGLPRMDQLTDKKFIESSKSSVYKKYPGLIKRKLIVYAPTFRDNTNSTMELRQAEDDLIANIDYDNYNLVLKRHPVDMASGIVCTKNNRIEENVFTTTQLMAAADVVITDYSSVIYEALLMNKDIYIFCFDGEKYLDERGFYINFFEDIPAVFSKDAKELCEKINLKVKCNEEKVNQFKKDYVNKQFDSISYIYAQLIDEISRGVYDGRYNYKGDVNEEN